MVYHCTKQISVARRIAFDAYGVSVYLDIVKYQTHSILSLNTKRTVSHSVLAMNTKRPAGACHPRPQWTAESNRGTLFCSGNFFVEVFENAY